MTFVIGVDGGGTRARAVIVDEVGKELGRGEAPGAVVRAESPAEAAGGVTRAVREAALAADVCLPGAVLWAGLSGAGREEARRAVLEELSQAALADRVLVGTDVEAAFHSAFGDGPGVLLIAGTGSIAWARDAEGRVVRVGGWGALLGDEGSGYAIGMGAVRAVVRAEDGRSDPTALREAVLDALGSSDPEALIPWAASATKADVASLAPSVALAAARGDPAAIALLDEAARELAGHVVAILEGGGVWQGAAPLVLWGGLIGHGGPLRGRLVEALVSQPVELVEEEPDPVMGAALLALSALRETSPHEA